MNDLISKLLQPVSVDQPCGADLSYDPRLDQLETILLGKPEIDIGTYKKPAEPPDWLELREKSAEFLTQSKHLRVLIMFCCASLRTEGWAGFRDGLDLLATALEQFWPTLYPLLDPEDNNDPTQRLNLLSALVPRREAMGVGWLRFEDYLLITPICQPKGGTPITFEQLQTAKLKASAKDGSSGAGSSGPDLGKLEAAIRTSGGDQVAKCHQLLQESLGSVNRMDRFLTTTLGPGNTISFEVLQKLLEQMLTALGPYLHGAVAIASVSPASSLQTAGGPVETGGISVHGPIRSRQDVARAIDGICEYYRQVEPSSPVPYLLRRAQMLATMNFVQAVQELNLGTVDALRPSMGSAVDGAAPASSTPSVPAN